jgi:hypothetical protein
MSPSTRSFENAAMQQAAHHSSARRAAAAPQPHINLARHHHASSKAFNLHSTVQRPISVTLLMIAVAARTEFQ